MCVYIDFVCECVCVEEVSFFFSVVVLDGLGPLISQLVSRTEKRARLKAASPSQVPSILYEGQQRWCGRRCLTNLSVAQSESQPLRMHMHGSVRAE